MAARPPAARAPTGAAPHTRPRQAPPTRPMRSGGVSRWRSEMATTDPAPIARPTTAKAGPASSQPLATRHDQVAHAGDERGADQGVAISEAADHPVRPQAPDEGPGRAGGQEDPVGAFPDPPYLGRQQHQDAALHPLEAGQGAHHDEQEPQPVVGEEEPGTLPGRRRGPFRLRRFRAEADEGYAGQDRHNGIGEEGDRLAHGEEPRADHRSGELLGARLGTAEHAVGMLERIRVHQLGHDRLGRGVVHGPPAGVDQHDHDQDRPASSGRSE